MGLADNRFAVVRHVRSMSPSVLTLIVSVVPLTAAILAHYSASDSAFRYFRSPSNWLWVSLVLVVIIVLQYKAWRSLESGRRVDDLKRFLVGRWDEANEQKTAWLAMTGLRPDSADQYAKNWERATIEGMKGLHWDEFVPLLQDDSRPEASFPVDDPALSKVIDWLDRRLANIQDIIRHVGWVHR